MRRRSAEHILYRRGLEQSLQHAARTAMLQALVGGQGVLRSIPAMAKLADVEGVGLLVLVLKVSL